MYFNLGLILYQDLLSDEDQGELCRRFQCHGRTTEEKSRMFDVEVTELNPSLSFTILLYDEYIYIGINNHNFDKLQAAVTIRLTDSFTVQGHTHCPQAVGSISLEYQNLHLREFV